MNLKWILLGIAWIIAVCPLSARKINAVGWTDRLEKLFVRTESDFKELQFRNNRASPMVDIGEIDTVLFYEKVPIKGENIYPVAEVDLINRDTELLLIFFPFKDGKGSKWKVVAKDDSLEKFPLDTIDIINLTFKKMGGFVDKKKMVLEPMKTKRVDLSHINKFSFQLKVNSFDQKSKKMKKQVRQSLSYRKGIRIIGIIMNENSKLETEPFWSIIRLGPNKDNLDMSRLLE